MNYLITGLGNPGKKFQYNRHNIGFMAVDILAGHFRIPVDEKYKKSNLGKYIKNNLSIYLLKPLTYMNLSGEMVRKVMATYKIPVQNIIVIYDDIDLPLGKIRIRKDGSAGGHNGMKSVIDCLQNNNFLRIRVGIHSELKNRVPLEDFVLSDFTEKETAVISESLKNIPAIIDTIIYQSIDKAMNEYN